MGSVRLNSALETMIMNTNNTLIPDRSQPGLTITAPTVRQRDGGDKYAYGVPKVKKIRGRQNISVGTWNVRTLRSAEELDSCNEQVSLEHSGALSAKCAGKTLVRRQQMTDTRLMQ